MKILLAEDDYVTRKAMDSFLSKYGECDVTVDGMEAVDAFMMALEEDEPYDLVCLDIMMPVMDGIKAMTSIREISNAPVILLTAKSEDYDKVLGLTAGADDYVTKPFNPIEVQARVKSQIRRYTKLGSKVEAPDRIVFGGIEIDNRTKQVTLDGEKVNLTKTEY